MATITFTKSKKNVLLIDQKVKIVYEITQHVNRKWKLYVVIFGIGS